MTAAAIASTRAMIDFHGRVLRLTWATLADRSICLSCTRTSCQASGLTLSGRKRVPWATRHNRRARLAGKTGKIGAGTGPPRPGPSTYAIKVLLDQRRTHGEPELAAHAGRHACT